MKFLVALLIIAAFHARSFAQEAVPEERGLVLNSAGAFDGYTLFAPLTENAIYVLDMEGEVVKRWPMESVIESVRLLDSVIPSRTNSTRRGLDRLRQPTSAFPAHQQIAE